MTVLGLQSYTRVAVAIGGVTVTGGFGGGLQQLISKLRGLRVLLGLQQGIQHTEIPGAEGGR